MISLTIVGLNGVHRMCVDECQSAQGIQVGHLFKTLLLKGNNVKGFGVEDVKVKESALDTCLNEGIEIRDDCCQYVDTG